MSYIQGFIWSDDKDKFKLKKNLLLNRKAKKEFKKFKRSLNNTSKYNGYSSDYNKAKHGPTYKNKYKSGKIVLKHH